MEEDEADEPIGVTCVEFPKCKFCIVVEFEGIRDGD